MDAHKTTTQELVSHDVVAPPTVSTTALEHAPGQLPAKAPEKGAIGIAFLVWLFGGGLGLALLVFFVLKAC